MKQEFSYTEFPFHKMMYVNMLCISFISLHFCPDKLFDQSLL